MIASRRLRFNFALDRALEHCRALHKPLVVFEALRSGYEWASERMHHFVMDGMVDNARTCEEQGVFYYPYVESVVGAGRGLLEALAEDAAVVVTDDYPCFFLPRMVAAAGKRLSVRLEAVDSSGLLPLRATEQVFGRAFDFRRFLQKALPTHLSEFPVAEPLVKMDFLSRAKMRKGITSRWPTVTNTQLRGTPEFLASLPIDHQVRRAEPRGGMVQAGRQLKEFFERKLSRYGEERNEPELDIASGLSPFLHFGHISVHEVFREVARVEKWRPERLSLRVNGSREGWWNMSAAAEGFLDELITWREVGYNFSVHRKDYDQYESLPEWAQKTLKEHTRDERKYLYSLEQFATAKTHDPLWNAAQTQLVREGKIHNYLRMLWGKKILEWTRTPQEAVQIMIELNNKYGLDGRDPNSYSGIFWVMGRYDRPWGPERPVFGLIRYMSSENTARKIRVKKYIEKYSSGGQVAIEF
jgi:deoxyribodipyrimidine photo-lyase